MRAASTGSPASRRLTKLTPLTTRPSLTSRQGMTRTLNMALRMGLCERDFVNGASTVTKWGARLGFSEFIRIGDRPVENRGWTATSGLQNVWHRAMFASIRNSLRYVKFKSAKKAMQRAIKLPRYLGSKYRCPICGVGLRAFK